jgi:hypothetical protein
MQTLVEPIEIGKEKAAILVYKNGDLKAHQILFLAAQKENTELEKLEAITGTSKKALSELSAFDLEIAGSVAALFLM